MSRKLADYEKVAVCCSWSERTKTSLRLLRDKAKLYFLLVVDVRQKKRPLLESFNDVKPSKTQFHRSEGIALNPCSRRSNLSSFRFQAILVGHRIA